MSEDVWPLFIGKRVRVRGRSGVDYEGELVSVLPSYIILNNGHGLIWINRVKASIESLQPIPG